MNGIDRTTTITINNEEYNLVMTTAATREIIARFGGLEKIGEVIEAQGAGGIGELAWMIALLANQGIKQENYLNNAKRKEITAEYVELFTTPADIADMQGALIEALTKGSRRDIKSEQKN